MRSHRKTENNGGQRSTSPENPHRGNLRSTIFFSDEDRLVYLKLLRQCSERFALDVWSFCLMDNHVHILGVGRKKDSLSRALGLAHQRYSSVINVQHGWTGHLWANRFFSTPLDDDHLWAAVRYVELNPVRAGMVKRAEEYPWSSAAVHCGLRSCGVLSATRPFPGKVGDWASWLARGLDQEVERRLRDNTYSGRPTGSEAFIDRLESETGRLLRPQKPGRKSKTCDDGAILIDDLFA